MYMYVCIYVGKYECMNVCVFMFVWLYVCFYVGKYVCMYNCICMYVRMNV